MKRFVFTLLGLSFAMILVIAVMHIAAMWQLREKVETAYTLDPSCDVLVIGSSQVGCSIDASPEFHNNVLWVSDTISPSILMRLKELERHGQLDKVKTLVVPFNFISVTSLTMYKYKWAWYQELPVSWRYLDMLPCSTLEFFCFVAGNLRCPLMMHVKDGVPVRDPLTKRPEAYRKKVIDEFVNSANEMTGIRGEIPDWEERFLACYSAMKAVCDRHQIRFVVYQPPLLKQYYDALSPECLSQESELISKLQALGIEYVATPRDYPESLFFDGVHMVISGARQFTEDLYSRMNIPMLSTNSSEHTENQ